MLELFTQYHNSLTGWFIAGGKVIQ